MDVYLNLIEAYTNKDTSFYRTDTDSIIVGQNEEEKLQRYNLKYLMICLNSIKKNSKSLQHSSASDFLRDFWLNTLLYFTDYSRDCIVFFASWISFDNNYRIDIIDTNFIDQKCILWWLMEKLYSC